MFALFVSANALSSKSSFRELWKITSKRKITVCPRPRSWSVLMETYDISQLFVFVVGPVTIDAGLPKSGGLWGSEPGPETGATGSRGRHKSKPNRAKVQKQSTGKLLRLPLVNGYECVSSHHCCAVYPHRGFIVSLLHWFMCRARPPGTRAYRSGRPLREHYWNSAFVVTVTIALLECR